MEGVVRTVREEEAGTEGASGQRFGTERFVGTNRDWRRLEESDEDEQRADADLT